MAAALALAASAALLLARPAQFQLSQALERGMGLVRRENARPASARDDAREGDPPSQDTHMREMLYRVPELSAVAIAVERASPPAQAGNARRATTKIAEFARAYYRTLGKGALSCRERARASSDLVELADRADEALCELFVSARRRAHVRALQEALHGLRRASERMLRDTELLATTI